MGVGEAGLAHQLHKGGAQPVAAAGAVLNDNAGNLLPDFLEEPLGGRHLPLEAVPQAVAAVHAQAHGLVVVHLEVAKASGLQLADDLFGEVIHHPGVLHVPEAPAAHGEGQDVDKRQG